MRRFLSRWVPAAAAVALVLAPSAAPAASASAASVPAASTPGWRITQLLPNTVVGGLWAGGSRDAWLAGDGCSDPRCNSNYGSVIVRHWDGKAWRTVTPPKAYINSPLDQGVGAIAATSASNAWVFAGRGTESIDYTDALHWTGKGWAAPVRFNTPIQAAVAPSATQLWAFGDGTTPRQPGYVAHFNGKTWTRGSFPFPGSAAAATSASDVWVGGAYFSTAGQAVAVEHWNGHVWRATPLPRLGLPTGNPSSGIVYFLGVAAVTSSDAWADVSILGNSGTVPGTILLHWNGKAWKRVAFPYSGSALTPVASDGHGGVWLAIENGPSATKLWFCHLSDGHWSRTAVPSRSGEQPLLSNLNWIPGTRSLWAAGTVNLDGGEAILKYGP